MATLTQQLDEVLNALASQTSMVATAQAGLTAATNDLEKIQKTADALKAQVNTAQAHSALLDRIEHGIAAGLQDAGIGNSLFADVGTAISEARALLNL